VAPTTTLTRKAFPLHTERRYGITADSKTLTVKTIEQAGWAPEIRDAQGRRSSAGSSNRPWQKELRSGQVKSEQGLRRWACTHRGQSSRSDRARAGARREEDEGAGSSQRCSTTAITGVEQGHNLASWEAGRRKVCAPPTDRDMAQAGSAGLGEIRAKPWTRRGSSTAGG
jgi:hypothetical protein